MDRLLEMQAFVAVVDAGSFVSWGRCASDVQVRGVAPGRRTRGPTRREAVAAHDTSTVVDTRRRTLPRALQGSDVWCGRCRSRGHAACRRVACQRARGVRAHAPCAAMACIHGAAPQADAGCNAGRPVRGSGGRRLRPGCARRATTQFVIGAPVVGGKTGGMPRFCGATDPRRNAWPAPCCGTTYRSPTRRRTGNSCNGTRRVTKLQSPPGANSITTIVSVPRAIR